MNPERGAEHGGRGDPGTERLPTSAQFGGATTPQKHSAPNAAKRYWLCGCGWRNERIKQKCANPDCNRRRPKKRVPPHARTLRDDPYVVYARLNNEIHGAAFGALWTQDCCGVCGKPPTTARHMDRDHDHTNGKPRGLACPGNQGCNALMPRQMTLERARQVVAYLERVEAHYA